MKYMRRYKSDLLQKAYVNACECISGGSGRETWDDCNVETSKADMVWNTAVADMQR